MASYTQTFPREGRGNHFGKGTLGKEKSKLWEEGQPEDIGQPGELLPASSPGFNPSHPTLHRAGMAVHACSLGIREGEAGQSEVQKRRKFCGRSEVPTWLRPPENTTEKSRVKAGNGGVSCAVIFPLPGTISKFLSGGLVCA